jgi:hypothetical protein
VKFFLQLFLSYSADVNQHLDQFLLLKKKKEKEIKILLRLPIHHYKIFVK